MIKYYVTTGYLHFRNTDYFIKNYVFKNIWSKLDLPISISVLVSSLYWCSKDWIIPRKTFSNVIPTKRLHLTFFFPLNFWPESPPFPNQAAKVRPNNSSPSASRRGSVSALMNPNFSHQATLSGWSSVRHVSRSVSRLVRVEKPRARWMCKREVIP